MDQTCESRSYVCCETLDPQDHQARHGYLPAGCTDKCNPTAHKEN